MFVYNSSRSEDIIHFLIRFLKFQFSFLIPKLLFVYRPQFKWILTRPVDGIRSSLPRCNTLLSLLPQYMRNKKEISKNSQNFENLSRKQRPKFKIGILEIFRCLSEAKQKTMFSFSNKSSIPHATSQI